MSAAPVNGILLLYYQPLDSAAPTIAEHVRAIPTYSRFTVWPMNTAAGFPPGLGALRFGAIVLHYSLFGPPPLFGSWPDGLNPRFLEYLEHATGSYKVAFFQDEHHFCRARFDFLNRYAVDSVFTLLDPSYWDVVYRAHTRVKRLTHTLTGYVDRAFVEKARAMYRPDSERTVDIGYRARRLPFYMGRGGQEKADIADGFCARAGGCGLALDIAVGEESRIYGDAWWRFLANCRGVLGVEAGVSIFDLDDSARIECDRLLVANPGLTFEDAFARSLTRWDGKIEYRTISPRHFEAAALRVCQILFEGKYNGILEPWVHYIPLRKDFSNIDDVLRAFGDPGMRRELTGNAYGDLIESGRWSYEPFVAGFDAQLEEAGLRPEISEADAAFVTRQLNRGRLRRRVHRLAAAARHVRFPGRGPLVAAVRQVLKRSQHAV